MSRIGKQQIEIPSGVTVDINGSNVTVKGSKGELKKTFHPTMKIVLEENILKVERVNEEKQTKALHGLTRSLLANMVEGVSKGFEKKLEIVGVGYRAQANKNKVTLNLGFSHPIEYTADQTVEIKLDEDNKNIMIVSGPDKELVGQAAADIRSYRKPEPYKGKGIKYIDEHIIRKAGKAAASAGSA